MEYLIKEMANKTDFFKVFSFKQSQIHKIQGLKSINDRLSFLISAIWCDSLGSNIKDDDFETSIISVTRKAGLWFDNGDSNRKIFNPRRLIKDKARGRDLLEKIESRLEVMQECPEKMAEYFEFFSRNTEMEKRIQCLTTFCRDLGGILKKAEADNIFNIPKKFYAKAYVEYEKAKEQASDEQTEKLWMVLITVLLAALRELIWDGENVGVLNLGGKNDTGEEVGGQKKDHNVAYANEFQTTEKSIRLTLFNKLNERERYAIPFENELSESWQNPFDRHPRILLCADYGAGKTYYLDRLKNSLTHTQQRKFQSCFFVNLKELEDEFPANPKAPITSYLNLTDYVKREGHGMRYLLADGLDEVPNNTFANIVLDELKEFADNDWRVILTVRASKPGGRLDYLVKAGFATFGLSPVRNQDITALITKLKKNRAVVSLSESVEKLAKRPVYFNMLQKIAEERNNMKIKNLECTYDVIRYHIHDTATALERSGGTSGGKTDITVPIALFVLPSIIADAYRDTPFAKIHFNKIKHAYEEFWEKSYRSAYLISVSKDTSLYRIDAANVQKPDLGQCLEVLVKSKMLLQPGQGEFYYFQHSVFFDFYLAYFEMQKLNTQQRRFKAWMDDRCKVDCIELRDLRLNMNMTVLAIEYFKEKNRLVDNVDIEKPLLSLFPGLVEEGTGKPERFPLKPELVCYTFSAYQISNYLNLEKRFKRAALLKIYHQVVDRCREFIQRDGSGKKIKAVIQDSKIRNNLIGIITLNAELVRIEPSATVAPERLNEHVKYAELMRVILDDVADDDVLTDTVEVSTATPLARDLKTQLSKFTIFTAHTLALKSNAVDQNTAKLLADGYTMLVSNHRYSDLAANLSYLMNVYPSPSLLKKGLWPISEEHGYGTAFMALYENVEYFMNTKHYGRDVDYQILRMIRMLLFGYVRLTSATIVSAIRKDNVQAGRYLLSIPAKNYEAAEFMFRRMLPTTDSFLCGYYYARIIMWKLYCKECARNKETHGNYEFEDLFTLVKNNEEHKKKICQQLEASSDREGKSRKLYILNLLLLYKLGKKDYENDIVDSLKQKAADVRSSKDQIDRTHPIYFFAEAMATIKYLKLSERIFKVSQSLEAGFSEQCMHILEQYLAKN